MICSVRPSNQLSKEHILQYNVFYVRYELRLKTDLSIKRLKQHSKTRWRREENGGPQYEGTRLAACTLSLNKQFKLTDKQVLVTVSRSKHIVMMIRVTALRTWILKSHIETYPL